MRILILIYLLSCVFIIDVAAHDVPVDQTGHHIQLVIFKNEVIVDYTIVFSKVAYLKTLAAMNTDGQGDISQPEKDLYHSAKRKQLLESLELMVDGKSVTLTDFEAIHEVTAERSEPTTPLPPCPPFPPYHNPPAPLW